MEGAGEGVVAVLQGTRHAGLRVTLVHNNRLRLKRKCMPMDIGVRSPTRITQSSVETNTERVFKNASAPTCDVRYAASYQFSNCKSVQSSYRVPEFRQHSTFYRHSDQFVDSLRKYPIEASSEILQRIINYSNIKQNNRKYNLRNIRPSLRKSRKQQMNRKYERGLNTTKEIYENRPLNKSISVIGRRFSSQKELANYTYDYLKCMSLIPKCADVRYLTQVKRCIRNRLLEIVDDRPVMCPRIRSRYNHHTRCYHGPTIPSTENEMREPSAATKFKQTACTNPSLLNRKSCFCHKPLKCDCISKLNKQNPLESLLTKFYPELNVSEKESKIETLEGRTMKFHDGVDAKIMAAVSEWLKSIPVYNNFSENDKLKQQELAFSLAQNLSSLKDQVDFISKAKMKIMSCVHDLPMWSPTDLDEKEQFFDQIVADLLKKLINVLEEEIKCTIAKIVSNLTNTEDIDREEIVDDLVNKMKTILILYPPVDDMDYKGTLKANILDLLNKLPIEYDKEHIHDVVDELVEHLLELRFNKSHVEEETPMEVQSFRENILKWCKNVPQLENIDFAQIIDLIDELANKFKNYESRKPRDDSLQAEIVKTIRTWLGDVAKTSNLRLNSKIKNRLSHKMANIFFGRGYNNTLNKKKSSEINSSEEALVPLLKWYDGIQELAGDDRDEIKKVLDRLAKELTEIQLRNYNCENILTDMKEVVTEWLQNMLIKKGKHLESKVFDNFVNKLISELNDIPKPINQKISEHDELYREIVSWIKDIPYLKRESLLNQNRTIEKFVNKLNNIHKTSENESTINEAVREFIQSLSEGFEVRINEREIQTLKDKLFDELNKERHTAKQRKRWDKVNDLCQSMLFEISNNLQAYSNTLGVTKINNIKDKFYEKLKQNIEENGLPNWDYLLRQIKNIFKQETKLSKNEYEDIANSIISRMQRRFSHEIARRSTILSEHERIIENKLNAPKKQKCQKDSSRPQNDKNKSKKAYYRNVNLQAGDGRKYRNHSKMSLIFKSSNSDLDLHDSVDYYDNNYNVTENQNDRSPLNGHKEFIKRTSTPLNAAMANFPSALDSVSPIRNVTGDTKKTLLNDSECSKQPQYLMKLKNVIMDWIKNIDPTITDIDLDDVVDGIASDVVDRQKYLQLSKIKYSDNDELEHLKYQIFRKFDKLKKYNTLPQIMSKINSLFHVIKNIDVPDFIKTVNESEIPATSINDNSIFNKINQWLDNVPSNLLKSSNIKHNPVLINRLVKNVENPKINNQYDYQMEKDILLWLQNILKNCNNIMFGKLAEDLKSNLKSSSNTSNLLKQDASKFIVENISEAIVAWLHTAPFYKICTLEEQYLQEKLALLLAANLNNILQTTNNGAHNINDLLVEEVQKYLKTILIAPELRNNNFYCNAATELVEYLKQSIPKIRALCDGTNNIQNTSTEINTPNKFEANKELIKNIINDWCGNLPIHLGHSPESKEQAKKLKQNIATRLLEHLSYLNQKESNDNNGLSVMLSEEINKIFNNVPMNRELERSLPILKSILIENLKQANIETQSSIPKKILQDTLTRTLQELENTPELERASLNLLKEKLADAFINLHYRSFTDNEFRDKLKDKLYNEINRFCYEYLEHYPNSSIDFDDLRFNLYAALKKVSIPDMQHLDMKLSFEKDVKNATTQYSSPQFLPSSLNLEDKAHLEIIRKRAAGYPENVNTERQHKDMFPCQFKEIGVQTDSKEKVEENVQTSKTLIAETIKYSKEILPQVVIKEFYWDSSGSKQSLQMFVPPALTPHKIIPRKKETNDSQNQTETIIINNSTKVHISQQLPDTREARSNNKVDKASEKTSQDIIEKQDHLNNSYLNSPVHEIQSNKTLISRKDSTHIQEQTEKPFRRYQRRGRVLDNDVNERYWGELPHSYDDNTHIRNERRQSSYLEDLVKTADDRQTLPQRIYLTPENRNKGNVCCDHNRSWRMRADFCRRNCNNTLRYCSKCCGGYCPHPTFAFFKKTF